MLNVLFIAIDTSQHLNKIYYYLEQELAKIVHLFIWRKPGHINYILKRIPFKPDFILYLNDLGKQMEPLIYGLSHIDIPVGLFVNDVHRFVKSRKNYMIKHNIPHFFTVSRDKFIHLYPEFTHKMEWFPHFVPTEIYHDTQIKKDIDLLMVGAINDLYPLRQKIVKVYEKNPCFVHHKHPGYQILEKHEKERHMIDDNYTKELNRAKIVFTCPSIFYYPVIKYFEVLACKTLLLAPTFTELEDLGFIPGYHFVPINEDNFMEKASYYLKNEEERQIIAEQGYQYIWKKHSAQIRAKQLVKRLASIIRH